MTNNKKKLPIYTIEEFIEEKNKGRKDYSNTVFQDDMKFEDLDLTGYDFSNAVMNGAEFINVKLIGAKMDNAILSYSKFNNVKFIGASLKGAYLNNTVIRLCDFTKANITKMVFTNAKYSFDSENVLNGSDFEGSIIEMDTPFEDKDFITFPKLIIGIVAITSLFSYAFI